MSEWIEGEFEKEKKKRFAYVEYLTDFKCWLVSTQPPTSGRRRWQDKHAQYKRFFGDEKHATEWATRMIQVWRLDGIKHGKPRKSYECSKTNGLQALEGEKP